MQLSYEAVLMPLYICQDDSSIAAAVHTCQALVFMQISVTSFSFSRFASTFTAASSEHDLQGCLHIQKSCVVDSAAFDLQFTNNLRRLQASRKACLCWHGLSCVLTAASSIIYILHRIGMLLGDVLSVSLHLLKGAIAMRTFQCLITLVYNSWAFV